MFKFEKYCFKVHKFQNDINCRSISNSDGVLLLNKMKHKIELDTDGDLKKNELNIFYKETEPERFKTSTLEYDKFLPLLLATFLIIKEKPKNHNYEYNLETIYHFTRDLFDKKLVRFNTKEDFLKNKLEKFPVLKKAFSDETLAALKEYAKKFVVDYKSYYCDMKNYSYDFGNQSIWIENQFCKKETRNSFDNKIEIKKNLLYKITIEPDCEDYINKLNIFYKKNEYNEYETKFLKYDTYLPLVVSTLLFFNLDGKYELNRIYNIIKNLFDKHNIKFKINENTIKTALKTFDILKDIAEKNDNNTKILLVKYTELENYIIKNKNSLIKYAEKIIKDFVNFECVPLLESIDLANNISIYIEVY